MDRIKIKYLLKILNLPLMFLGVYGLVWLVKAVQQFFVGGRPDSLYELLIFAYLIFALPPLFLGYSGLRAFIDKPLAHSLEKPLLFWILSPTLLYLLFFMTRQDGLKNAWELTIEFHPISVVLFVVPLAILLRLINMSLDKRKTTAI